LTRRAALFDMDRTLLKKDTAALYTQYRRDLGEAGIKDMLRVGWWMMQYTMGVIDAPRVALKALEHFRGREERWLVESCQGWFKEYVLEHVQPKGREAVARHRAQGDVVAIVTGATPYAANPLAAELGIETVVCTTLEVDGDGRFTGRPIEPLCYGAGKVELARRAGERLGFRVEEATFYSDSITDVPLLEVVKTPIVVNPDRRLRRVAQKRGWPIQDW
jgi:HAD superfamily hydrolase (TIGR01490 family)